MHDETVTQIVTADTHDLRRRVLRDGTPSHDVTYGQDDQPGTVHLGIRSSGRIVAVSTWAPEQWHAAPELAAVRLRGMAVEPTLQGTGVGARLVRAGLERAWAEGAELVWASARDSALGFYDRLGFAVVGDEFVDATTGLPHHHITISRPR